MKIGISAFIRVSKMRISDELQGLLVFVMALSCFGALFFVCSLIDPTVYNPEIKILKATTTSNTAILKSIVNTDGLYSDSHFEYFEYSESENNPNKYKTREVTVYPRIENFITALVLNLTSSTDYKFRFSVHSLMGTWKSPWRIFRTMKAPRVTLFPLSKNKDKIKIRGSIESENEDMLWWIEYGNNKGELHHLEYFSSSYWYKSSFKVYEEIKIYKVENIQIRIAVQDKIGGKIFYSNEISF